MTCGVCGCTEKKPCAGGCTWAANKLCSNCADAITMLVAWAKRAVHQNFFLLVEHAFKTLDHDDAAARIKNVSA